MADSRKDGGYTGRYDRTLNFVCIGLSIAAGMAYPILQVTFIAMAEKLLRKALASSLPNELYLQLEEDIFAQASNVTSVYLMRTFTFYQAFAVSAFLVLFLAIFLPIAWTLSRDYLNKQEVRRLQSLILQKFIVESNSFYVNLSDATNLMYTRMAAVDHYIGKIRYQTYLDFSSIFTGLLLFMCLAWDMGLITLVACTMIMVLTDFIYNKLSDPWVKQREDREAKINAHMLDLVVCKNVIRVHGRELKEQQNLENLLMNESVRRETRVLSRATFISQFFQVLTFTLIIPSLFVYAYEVDLTLTRVFQLLIIIVVLGEMMQSYARHLNKKPGTDEYKRAKQEFCHVLGMDEQDLFPKQFHWPRFCWEKYDKDDKHRAFIDEDIECNSGAAVPEIEPNLLQHKDDNSSIELTNTTFGYTQQDDTTARIIDNFNASFKLGDRYAIMGETGCGKSTIFKGLAGLLKPIEGIIRVDGEKIDTSSIQWRQDYIGVVQQESILFNRSLRENLAYGLDDDLERGVLDDMTILDALAKVNMKQIVLEMPKGLDTVIIRNGDELSGGQRQRLQICRLLLRNRPLVLLDECTSALDRVTMQDILGVLNVFLTDKDKTLIMITHDIQTLDIVQHVFNMTAGGGYEIQTLPQQPSHTSIEE